MANINEIWEGLPDLWEKLHHVESVQENAPMIRRLSLQGLWFYSSLKKRERTKDENLSAVCGIAVKLSGLVLPGTGLSGELFRFLQENEEKLPSRAAQVLRGNLVRMEGY